MFILLWEDKHVDTEIYIFKEFDNAYMFAKDRCEDVYEDNDTKVDYILDSAMRRAGWLFFAQAVNDTMTMRIEEIQYTK